MHKPEEWDAQTSLIFWVTNKSPNLGQTTRPTDGGARGVMVIVVGIVHGDTSSKPGRDWLHFT